jgi:S-formylglutathione hydrolase FrmB
MFAEHIVPGRHLEGNLLGDPTHREAFVYLPPDYDRSTERLPVAYLLHALGEGAASLVTPPTDGRRWSPPLVDVLDPIFGRLGAAPMIVVVPDGTTSYGHGQWVDSPVGGRFTSYLAEDVVGFVDATFRTRPEPSSRGVLGYSTGGLGAWTAVTKRPDIFGAGALLSADVDFEACLRPLLYDYLDQIWPDAPDGPVLGSDDSFTAYSYASAFSPNLDAPFFVDLPVEHPSGRRRGDVWARWRRFDPLENAVEHRETLQGLRGLLLDVGVADQYRIHWGHRQLSAVLSGLDITHTVWENTGNHGGRSRERTQLALQWLATILERDG